LSCWLWAGHFAFAFAVNITVQDTDPSIVYQPPGSWHASSDLLSCNMCLNPGGASSFHEAIHPAVTVSAYGIPPSARSNAMYPDDDRVERRNDVKRERSGKNRKRRTLERRFVHGIRGDPNTAEPQDPGITISFTFNGSAIYLFGIQPLGVPDVNGPPTSTNLSFSLDKQPAGSFKYVGSPDTSAFRADTPVLSLSGLEERQHRLVVTVGQGSTFLFDYLVYTSMADAKGSSTSTPPASPTQLANSTPSATQNQSVKKHNVATFAGAVGGSVGVLALFAICIALSIIRRRRLAARRDRFDRDSLHTEASDDSPNMSGPTPFVPRYFPGTVIPPDPPTYMAALAANHHESTLLGGYPAAHRSYADIPPTSPPPPLDDAVMIPPPPSFPEAISTPHLPSSALPSQREGSLPPPSISRSGEGSRSLQSSIDNDIRPRSRASSRRAVIRNRTSTNRLQMDGS